VTIAGPVLGGCLGLFHCARLRAQPRAPWSFGPKGTRFWALLAKLLSRLWIVPMKFIHLSVCCRSPRCFCFTITQKLAPQNSLFAGQIRLRHRRLYEFFGLSGTWGALGCWAGCCSSDY